MKKSELRQIIQEEIKKLLEVQQLDSEYLQRALKLSAEDLNYDAQEKVLGKLLIYIAARLNQSYPDSDVTQDHITDILKEPITRRLFKKTKMSLSAVMDFVWIK